MADVPVPSIATATPVAADTVAGVQGGAVKRFGVADLSSLAQSLAAGGMISWLPYNAEHTSWRAGIGSHTTYEGRNDEVFYLGYNIGGGVASEPLFGVTQENDYAVTVRGVAAQRTIEHYWQVAGTVAGTASRPYFWSFDVPNNVINYGYTLTGPNTIETAGGGGYAISSGIDGTNGRIMAFDVEGAKVTAPLLVNAATFNAYTSVTNNGTTDFTLNDLPAGHGFAAGSSVQVWKTVTAGYEKVGGVYPVKSVTATSVTLTGDNSSNTITNTPGTWGIRYPVPTGASGLMSALGIGISIQSGDTNVLHVVGPSAFTGGVRLTDPNANDFGFGVGTTLGISKQIDKFQSLGFSNTGGAYVFGHCNGNTATFALGPYQATDANFNSANSLITFNAGHGVGIGGTIAVSAKTRIAGGSATVMQMWLNNQTDGADFGSNPSGGGALYVKAGALMFRGSSGTITTVAPA
jgi:hypothetical protein